MRFEGLTVADLMSTAVLTLQAKDTTSAADLEMRMAGIRHLPVVDDRNHVVGMLSNRDLYRAFGSGTKIRRVHEIMTTGVITVTEETPAYQAARLMIKHKIGSLPVVGDEEQLVGIVTETDFLRVSYRALRGGNAPGIGDDDED